MDFYVENNPKLIKPTNFSGNMEGRKFGQEISNNRRALSAVNQNVGIQANKRALSGKHEMCEKKQADPSHRPITRKFAAVISNSQPLCPQESNKLTINESVDSISIYIDEDCKSSKEDHPIPMFLEEVDEAIIQEVEMEDIEEEGDEEEEESVIDIDGCDAKNPFAVVDYVDDLYAFYRKMEAHSCVLPNYMEQQFDINERMRAILIDWLIEVHDKFELMGETLFLTVNIIDRFLAQQTVVRKKLQLVGLVALLLACKYEEVSVPIVEDLVLISDKAYSRQEVLEMETLMLNKLQFNMSVPTPYVFMQRFLKASTTTTTGTQSEKKKIELLSFFLMELSLVEYEMINFSPSLLAAAATYTAQCTLYGFKQQWSRTCEWHSGYTQDKLLKCSRMMVGFHQKAATGKLTGVYRKYSTSKYSYTSRSEAACFLLETREI